jgi:hypothetical protein
VSTSRRSPRAFKRSRRRKPRWGFCTRLNTGDPQLESAPVSSIESIRRRFQAKTVSSLCFQKMRNLYHYDAGRVTPNPRPHGSSVGQKVPDSMLAATEEK